MLKINEKLLIISKLLVFWQNFSKHCVCALSKSEIQTKMWIYVNVFSTLFPIQIRQLIGSISVFTFSLLLA